MMLEIFSVFDQAAKQFLAPFTGPTVEFALRGFREACETDGHQFRKFPEDYVLHHIATFDQEDGTTTSFDPRKIGMATSFVHLPEYQTDIARSNEL